MQLAILSSEPIASAPPLCETCAVAGRVYCPHLTTSDLRPLTSDLKRCPRCEETLPLSAFGICCARKDGLNLYCKRCVNEKIALGRQRVRDYKYARRSQSKTPLLPQTAGVPVAAEFSPRRMARMLRKLTPTDRVREAISGGAETQSEIVRVTRLPKDEVCDHLANLLLWTREIRTEVINHERRYFVNEGLATPEHSVPKPAEPRSYGISAIYFQGEPEVRRARR